MTEPDTRSGTFLRALAQFTTRRCGAVLLFAGAIAIVSILSVMRLRPVASVDAMLGSDEPSARALKSISEHFAGMEELIVLASIPETESSDEGESADRLLDFAQRLTTGIAESNFLASMCHGVAYRPPPDMRSFVESVIVPNSLYYLNDEAIVALKQRLEPDAMREQLLRMKEMLATPGAGGVLVKQMLKDPLDLRSILASALPDFGKTGGDAFGSNSGFFSRDGRHLMIRVRGIKPASDLEFAVAFSDGVRDLAERINKSGLDLAYAGAYPIAAESQRSIRGDMIRSIVLSIVFLQILYGLAYRNLWMLPAALAPVALGILVGFAIFAALGMSLSPITAVIGAVLGGLGIDYTIHNLSHYESHRAEGLPHDLAIERTLRDVAPALIAACVTTVIGFLAISLSSVQALREFGLLGAMALVASLVSAILVLPAILTITVSRRRSHTSTSSTATPLSSRVLRHAITHRRLFLALGAMVLVTEIGYSLTPRTTGSIFEDDLRVMHPQPNAPLDTQRRLAQLFQTSPDTLLVYVEAASADALNATAHRVQERIARLALEDANIVGTYGLATLLPDPARVDQSRSATANLDAERVVANFDSALADSALNPAAFDSYRDFLRSLLQPDAPPQVSDVLRFPSLAESVLPLRHSSSSSPDSSTNERLSRPETSRGLKPAARNEGVESALVEPRCASSAHQAITAVLTAAPLADRTMRDTTIAALRSAIGDIHGATLTGLTVVGHDTEHTIRRDLRKLLSFAAGGVVLWLLIYFRGVRATFMALIPVACGFVVMLTCVRLFGLKLNTVNLIALPLLVGVGVDDGIFLVTIARAMRGKRARNNANHTTREAACPSDAVSDSDALVSRLSAGCHAIVMTSLTTMLTFGTLAFTSTPAIQSLGIVMVLGVMAALVGAIWILAPLLARR